MEKLIELLNEYEEKYRDFHFVGEDVREFTEFEMAFIISKKFGFIKWLVENDKIDIKKLIVKGEMRSGWDFENKKGDEEEGEEIWNRYWSELCLMLLSIQDEPIEFLVSILK